MDFKNIPVEMQPAYTWLWNATITKEGIKEQIDEMYEAGIRAFYALGEPENFRPHLRKTHLSPEYLSDEYIDLVFYAFEVCKEKGMHMWLYNEGGFPSGMVCGKIKELKPELSKREIKSQKYVYKKGEKLLTENNVVAVFAGGVRLKEGYVFDADTEALKYIACDDDVYYLNTDIAKKQTTREFILMTHEKLKKRFGEAMGNEIKIMFDDEACMGTWSDGLEVIFKNKYGYEIEDYLPCICKEKEPEGEMEHRAMSDYFMLCGELVQKNYFEPMKKWLRENNMLSAGHLDNDHTAKGAVINRYGNSLKTLREFDVPGVDVIWNQIIYPKNGKVCDGGMDFFPRFAASAARQLGHSKALSESLAVYGSHVDPELMRYVAGYQAVRGISLFNFMVISYDRRTAMVHQYRPNFVKENPCMNHLKEINDYVARLSYILQSSKADITTALYYPARSICACGAKGERAVKSFETIGEMLEKAGVSFDIIDEEIVLNAEIKNNALVYNDLIYENVFVPEGDFEIVEVTEKLKNLKSEIKPCIKRANEFILARRLVFDGDGEGYLIVNTSDETVCDTLSVENNKKAYFVDILSGEIYNAVCKTDGKACKFDVTLSKGEAIVLYFTDKEIKAKSFPEKSFVCNISDFESYISREYKIDAEKNIVNTYYSSGDTRYGLYKWEDGFAGEITYTCKLPELEGGEYELDLGEVKSVACVYINGVLSGKAVFPPYKVKLDIKEKENELKIVVSNTAARQCVKTDFFNNQDILDVGPYNKNMVIAEEKYGGGGFKGPVALNKLG